MEICRFCSRSVRVEFCKNIFKNEQIDPSIPEIVELLANLKIIESDPYTKQSCFDCFNILIIFYNYRKTILSTNQLLIDEKININNSSNCGNFSKNKLNDDGQFILIHDSTNPTETTLQIKRELEDRTISENNQHSNLIDIDRGVFDDIKINCNEDYNCVFIEEDNQKLHDFIKDEISAEETCLKIGKDFDKDQEIQTNNSNSNTPVYIDNGINNNDGENLIGNEQNHSEKNVSVENEVVKKSYRCDICKKRFKTIQHIKLHLMLHTDNKSYQCKICAKTFRLKRNLILHSFAIHKGKKPYQCHICNKKFIKPCELEKHSLTHEKSYYYRCDNCDEKFKVEKYFKDHLLLHSREKLEKYYRCHICDQRFLTGDELKQHLSAHTNDKPYLCHICGQEYVTIVNLKKHLKMICETELS